MIKILCVGKMKEKYWREALEEYQKRLSKYTKLSIVEVTDFEGDHIPTILEKEKNLLIKQIDSKDYVITMDIGGNELSSVELSEKIESIFLSHSRRIVWST